MVAARHHLEAAAARLRRSGEDRAAAAVERLTKRLADALERDAGAEDRGRR